MKRENKFKIKDLNLKDKNSLSEIKKICRKTLGKDEIDNEILAVIEATFSSESLIPSLKLRREITLSEYIPKWIDKYLKNRERSLKKDIGNSSKTYNDSVLEFVLRLVLDQKKESISNIVKGHKLLMTVENLIGRFLEEYIASKCNLYGWYACWGEVTNKVDFCKIEKNGKISLLQIKNSSNSENSSSKTVRNNTPIKIWYRRIATHENNYKWDELNKIIGGENIFSEYGFKKFILNIIKENPEIVCLKEFLGKSND